MRISIAAAIAAATLFATAAEAIPGFTYQPPSDYGWNYIAPRPFTVGGDGARYGVFTDQFQWHLGQRRGESLLSPLIKPLLESALGPAETDLADVTVKAYAVPMAASDAASVSAMLTAELNKLAARRNSSEWENLTGEAKAASIDGASCLRWEGTATQRQVFGPMKLKIHRLLCSHPEFPAYAVFMDFTMRDGKDALEKQGLAVLDSLKFKRLGYKVRIIPVGTTPQVLAEAEGALWFTWGGDNGKVGRIDPKTMTVTDNIPVGRVPIGMAADANGLWVANNASNTVSQIDPVTKSVKRTIPVSAGPLVVASGLGSIWVSLTKAGKVARIDPVSGVVSEIGDAGKEPSSIAVADGAVYVSDYRAKTVARIDPATNKVTGRLKSAIAVNQLLWDGRFLWGSSQDVENPTLLQIDPASPGAEQPRYQYYCYKPSGMAMWNGKLFVANWDGATLSVIDPKAPDKLIAYLPAGESPISVLVAQGALWAVASATTRPGGAPAILRFDPE